MQTDPKIANIANRCVEAGFEPVQGHEPTARALSGLMEGNAVQEALYILNMVHSGNADFVACVQGLLQGGGAA
jgi:hypothetical protein